MSRAFVEGVQDPVYESGRVLPAVGFRQVDALLDGYLGWDVLEIEELGGGKPEDRSIHDRQAFQSPVLQGALESPVYIGKVILESLEE